jgi:hypothetical protein
MTASWSEGATKPSRSEALAKVRPPGRAVEPGGAQAREVVGGALALPAARPRHHRVVPGADELLELRLRLAQRTGDRVGRLGPERERLVAHQRREPYASAAVERGADLPRRDVEVMGVSVVEGGGDVLPEVGERRLDVLLGGEQHVGVAHQVEEPVELLDRQELGDVRPLGLVLERRDLRELAVLGRQLSGGRDLDRLRLAQRALGERREPAQRLDLVAEEVDAHGALLGGGVEIEQPAPDRELAAVLDLLDALVPGRHQVLRRLLEVQELAHPQREAMRAQSGVGHLLAERDRADDDDRRLLVPFGEEGVERRDAQPDEVRRRDEVRLVGDPPRRVEANRSGRQPGAQVHGQVARGAVVAGHHQRRASWSLVEEGGDQVRAQRGGDVGTAAVARQCGGGRVVGGVVKEGSEHDERPRTRRGGNRHPV